MKKVILTICLLVLLAGCNNQQQAKQQERETSPAVEKSEQTITETNKNKPTPAVEKNEESMKNNNVNQEEVLIRKEGDNNSVVYIYKNGGELIIDQAPISSKQFINARFSPKKNYVLYSDKSWSHENVELFKIYDITNLKNVHNDNAANYFGDNVYFTPDEKYIYACGSDYFLGYGKVYLTSESKEIYSVHGKVIGEEKVEFYNDYRVRFDSCHYNDKNKKIEFEIQNVSNPNNIKKVFFDIKN